MPKPAYPFPTAGSLFWRNRHTFTGDTTPPTFPGGPPSLTTRVMLHEGTPSGDGGGVYDADTRGVGLGEPPASAAINRGLYDIRCALDVLFENDNAELNITTGAAVVSGGAPNYLVATTQFAATNLVYLGPGTTTPTSGADPELWCSNFVKIWGPGAQGPVYSPVTGAPYAVRNVFDSSGTLSLYTPASFPSDAEVYPHGTPGVLDIVGAGTITFTSLPVGLLAANPVYQCLFNYTQFEREIELGIGPGGTGDVLNAFATALTVAAGTYTMDRLIAGLGWAHGDYVYLTHFAYNPRPSLVEAYAPGVESALVHGTFWSAGWGRTQRFLDFLRFAGTSTFAPPLTVTEPASATMYSFDYANALFRADDGVLKGTVGFDFQGAADSPMAAADAYAGFLHRKAMSFNSAGNTIIGGLEAATWVAAGPSQFWVAGAQLHGAAAENTNLLPGIDLIQVEDAVLGTIALLVLDAIVDATHFDVVDLTGAAWVPPAGSVGGWVTVYRPQARTGMWDSAGVLAGYRGGNLFLGDSYLWAESPAAVMFGVGGSDLQAGWNASLPRDFAGAVDNTPIRRFRVPYSGAVEFSGLLPPGTTCRGRMAGLILPDPVPAVNPWAAGTESWSTTLSAVDEGAAHAWAARGAHFHAIEESAGPNSMALGLNANTTIDAGLAATERSHLWFGFPGNSYPLVGIVKAGDRSAGFAYGHRDSLGNMHTGLGYTTANGAWSRWLEVAELSLVGPPNPGVLPPAAQFGANPARVNLEASTSIGWYSARTFYHHPHIACGEPWDRAAWDYGFISFARWADPSIAGQGSDSSAAIDFHVNLPHNCVVVSVELKYFLWNVMATVGREPTLAMYYLDPDWANPNANPVGNAEVLLGGLPTVGGTGVGYHVVTYAVPAPVLGVDKAVVNNDDRQYVIRYWGAYDSHAAPTLNGQSVAAIRVTYTLRDLLPA